MRRTIFVAVLTAALTVFTAGPAFAAHCVNLSKEPDAGNLTTVVIDANTGQETIVGGQIKGGYADIWIDLDGDGMGDVLEAEDVQIGRNHSPQYDEMTPWVNPGATNKAGNPNATDDHGMGFHDEHEAERSE